MNVLAGEGVGLSPELCRKLQIMARYWCREAMMKKLGLIWLAGNASAALKDEIRWDAGSYWIVLGAMSFEATLQGTHYCPNPVSESSPAIV